MSNRSPSRRIGRMRLDVVGIDDSRGHACLDDVEDLLDGQCDYEVIQHERDLHNKLHEQEVE